MPALPRVGEADRLSVLDDVREDHHLGDTGLLVRVRGDVDLQVAELPAEVAQLAPGKLLARKAHDAVLAQRLEHAVELGGLQGPREIQALDRGAQRFAARCDFEGQSILKPMSFTILA